MIIGLASAAFVHVLVGRSRGGCASLLREIESTPAARRERRNYAGRISPAMVRTALAAGARPALAGGLVAGFEARHPYGERTRSSQRKRGARRRPGRPCRWAAATYSDAAGRWERFGVVPEQAFALLGQGRCLVGLGRPAEAQPVLRVARALFERLGADPALAETDALLERATALSS